MGGSISVVEYKELLHNLSGKDVDNSDRDSVQKFCEYSSETSEQSMIFSAVTPEDIKALKTSKPMNLLYIIREVVDIFHTNVVSIKCFEDTTQIGLVKG